MKIIAPSPNTKMPILKPGGIYLILIVVLWYSEAEILDNWT